MSISDGNIGLVRVALVDVCEEGPVWKGLKMGELGNQKILSKGPNGKDVHQGTSKKRFTDKGVEHTSFDLNGKDGAIALDLCETLPEKWCGYFDMVTNYGTTEHVENQWQVFKNIHDMTRVGGAMVHSIPHVGYWKNHCPYHYSPEFPSILANANGYELSYTEIQIRHKTNKLVNFVLIKGNQEFQSKKSFGEGIKFSKGYKHNTDNLF